MLVILYEAICGHVHFIVSFNDNNIISFNEHYQNTVKAWEISFNDKQKGLYV